MFTSLIIGLLIAEAITRVFLVEFDPEREVAFRRNASGVTTAASPGVYRQIRRSGDYDVGVRINRHGLRDPRDIVTARAADVVVLGDSFAFGWGVEEPERVSNRIDRALPDTTVYNLAAPGDLED